VVETGSIHLQKRPATRFNAYDALFSIRKQDDESLTSAQTRVDQAMQQVKDLRPRHSNLMIWMETCIMSLIDHSQMTTAVYLIPHALKQFDLHCCQRCLVMEEQNRRPRATDSPIASQYNCTGFKICVCGFCDALDTPRKCATRRDASRKAMEEVKAGNQKGKNKKKGQGPSRQ